MNYCPKHLPPSIADSYINKKGPAIAEPFGIVFKYRIIFELGSLSHVHRLCTQL